jgi:hypothetical protein
MKEEKYNEAVRIKAKLDQARRWLECVEKSNSVEFSWEPTFSIGILEVTGLYFKEWSGFFRKDDYAMQEIFEQVKSTAIDELKKRIDRWEKAMEAL